MAGAILTEVLEKKILLDYSFDYTYVLFCHSFGFWDLSRILVG
jgi:hypothetical protein